MMPAAGWVSFIEVIKVTKQSCTADLTGLLHSWIHRSPSGKETAHPFDYIGEGWQERNQWRSWAVEAEKIQIHWAVVKNGDTVLDRGMFPACFRNITGIVVSDDTSLLFSARRKINEKWRSWWSER